MLLVFLIMKMRFRYHRCPHYYLQKLAHFHQKQQSLEDKKARENHAVFLLGKSGLVERSKQRTTALSQAEEVMRTQAGWKYWDYLLQAVGGQNSAALQDLVAQPERFIANRQHTVISLSD